MVPTHTSSVKYGSYTHPSPTCTYAHQTQILEFVFSWQSKKIHELNIGYVSTSDFTTAGTFGQLTSAHWTWDTPLEARARQGRWTWTLPVWCERTSWSWGSSILIERIQHRPLSCVPWSWSNLVRARPGILVSSEPVTIVPILSITSSRADRHLDTSDRCSRYRHHQHKYRINITFSLAKLLQMSNFKS